MSSTYNNIVISSFAIHAVAQNISVLPMSKMLLILPLISNRRLLSHLASKNTQIYGIEQLIVSRNRDFTNFNERFYDLLTTSINALQLLVAIKYLDFSATSVALTCKNTLKYESTMGKRTEKIFLAAPKIAQILESSDPDVIYLNLRIQL